MVDVYTNPLETLIGYRLRRASADAMGDLARELNKLGLRPTEASALLLISVNNGMTQSEIGRILGIQRANMAPLTAGLERQGLITRHRMDGRSQSLVVSETGAETAARVHVAMKHHDQKLVLQVPEPARRGFTEALDKLAPVT